MSYTQPFAARIGAMGDMAEAVFESVYPESWCRYGLNRPNIYLGDVPAFVRHTPDYLTAKGLVEVGGFGADGTYKFKIEKAEALMAWHQLWRTDLFLYDSKLKQYGWVRLPEIIEVSRALTPKVFSEGKPYWPIARDEIPVVGSWQPSAP